MILTALRAQQTATSTLAEHLLDGWGRSPILKAAAAQFWP